jgi:hypothetical protein
MLGVRVRLGGVRFLYLLLELGHNVQVIVQVNIVAYRAALIRQIFVVVCGRRGFESHRHNKNGRASQQVVATVLKTVRSNQSRVGSTPTPSAKPDKVLATRWFMVAIAR